MALVEAVIREFGQQVEDGIGLTLLDAVPDRAFLETDTLLVHFRLDLLAHGATQHVGFAQRIARQELGDLHHLFLINDDAVGLVEHRGERFVGVDDLLSPVFPVDEARDVVHRAGPIERVHRDQIFDAVGFELDQRAAHARTFKLEDAVGIAVGVELVSRCILERDGVDIELDAGFLDHIDRIANRGQRLEPKKVELHQSRRFNPFQVVLGDRHV